MLYRYVKSVPHYLKGFAVETVEFGYLIATSHLCTLTSRVT